MLPSGLGAAVLPTTPAGVIFYCPRTYDMASAPIQVYVDGFWPNSRTTQAFESDRNRYASVLPIHTFGSDYISFGDEYRFAG